TAAAIAWIWSIVDGQYTVLNARLENVSSNVRLTRQCATETAQRVDSAVAQQLGQVEDGLAQIRKQVGDVQGQLTQAQSAATQAQAEAARARGETQAQ